MEKFKAECKSTIAKTLALLQQNSEWINRYDKYANAISNNIKVIKRNKTKFREWAPLYLYMNVSAAKSHLAFSVRYRGQDVATLKVEDTRVRISTKGFEEKNKRDFNCTVPLNDSDWRSKEASEFRRFFSTKPLRTKKSGKGNEEHRIESLLLTEFSKKSSKNKKLINIQPVKLAGISRFQLPTPLSASTIQKLKYSGAGGGGIDILSRVKNGTATQLCIMEVKDENTPKEPPTEVIQQGLAYATFVSELLKSSSGKIWWEIFGFSGSIPKKLELNVVCVLPFPPNQTFFGNVSIDNNNDLFHLHFLYFEETGNQIMQIDTSLR